MNTLLVSLLQVGPSDITNLLYLLLFVLIAGAIIYVIVMYLPRWNAPQPLKMLLGAVVIVIIIFVLLRMAGII